MQRIQEWINENYTDDDLLYKKAFLDQVFWVRDTLCCRIAKEHEFDVYISNTHRSKSVTLPVYHVTIEGRQFEFRCNFHDWCCVGSKDITNKVPDYIFKNFHQGYYEGITLPNEMMFCVETKEEFFMTMQWIIHEGYKS